MARKRIMVVEDEGITAMRIQSSLKDMGFDVTSTVFSGEEALKKAGKDRPDLVLMDIVLDGDIDGIEAAARIYSDFNIPVVYLTAHSDESMLRRMKNTESFGYIIKPFDERELGVVVKMAIYKHEMGRKLKDRENELKRHREYLSELVEERTAELTASVELLRQEIGDRRLAEAEAVRAGHLAALGELAAGVAHEINNPINGIINYAQILTNKSEKGSAVYDIAGRIIKESDRIAGIVRNLLSFARDSREKKDTVRIQTILADSLALTESQLRKNGIVLKAEIPENLPAITAQAQQLEQVFLNIISNAQYALNQKYPGAHKDKVLEIKCTEITVNNEPYIRITFHDRGTGIPDEIMNKVMNPFYSTKPTNVGTGLGLSISHNIIKGHGGKLFIESAEGQYTSIIIELPLRECRTSEPG